MSAVEEAAEQAARTTFGARQDDLEEERCCFEGGEDRWVACEIVYAHVRG